MALSNYEKQKRWREKNRGLYNFQQRQRRKKGGDNHATKNIRDADAGCSGTDAGSRSPDSGTAIEAGKDATYDRAITSGRRKTITSAAPTVQSAGTVTIESLRELVKVEQERAVEAPVASPARFGTYRDDGGRPITEAAWKRLQELKERAKGKYEIDDYSQA